LEKSEDAFLLALLLALKNNEIFKVTVKGRKKMMECLEMRSIFLLGFQRWQLSMTTM